MSIGTWVDERIANVLEILGVEKRLDSMQADANQQLDQLRQDAKQQLEQLRQDAKDEIAITRDEALGMMKDTLPQMAGEVSKAAVTEVFKETQADETVDRVAGVFDNILDKIPFGLGRAR